MGRPRLDIDDDFTRLVRAGAKLVDIQKTLGISECCAGLTLKRLGLRDELKRNQSKFDAEKVKRIKALVDSGEYVIDSESIANQIIGMLYN